jgi:protein O-GlcNAc transferase
VPTLPEIDQAVTSQIKQYVTQVLSAHTKGDMVAVEHFCDLILETQSDHALALNLMAIVRAQQNRVTDALELSDRAVALAPDDAGIWAGRAEILIRWGRYNDALSTSDSALELDPELVSAHINRGVALLSLFRFREARTAFDSALELNPSLKDVMLANIAQVHIEERQFESARKIADSLAARFPWNHSLAVLRARFSMHTPSITRAESRTLMMAVWSTMPGAVTHLVHHSHDILSPNRKLRIGYFSADVKHHPVAKFLRPALFRRDRSLFEVRLYDVTPEPDDFSDEIRSLVDGYHNGLGQSDAELAQSIYDDQVDLLIDLTGYSKYNRLAVFRHRPAPIQAHWIGYSGTSGLPEMDYVIADRHVCPPEADVDFTETIVRLPNTYLCFEPYEQREALPRRPIAAGQRVTFGSFNDYLKVNQEVVNAWSEILKRVPNSRLLLKTKMLENAELRDHFRKQFEARGVSRDRLVFMGSLSADAHLAAYNDVDIALDPFPYCGTTTTVDALYMGVPLVTLIGERWVQRTSYSFLTEMGLGEFCAETVPGYISLATDLAKDPVRLEALRSKVREKFLKSSLCDADQFTADLESAYRAMWQSYCQQNSNC